MFLRTATRAALAVALLGAGVEPATAGSFSVNPVRVELSATQRVAALTVRNQGTERAVVQLESLAWSQDGGKDRFEETRDLLATPPIFTLAPGASQLVRVGIRRAPDPSRELSYRLFLREIPGPTRPGEQGLRVALHIGVSSFIAPLAPAAPDLHWSARRNAPGSLSLALDNRGTAHAQIIRYALSRDGAGTPFQSTPAAEYALPGSGLRWTIQSPTPLSAGTVVHVQAETDRGPVAADVTVE